MLDEIRKIFKYDFYGILIRTIRFNTFWLFFSGSLLAVLMGIHSNKLSSYTSGIEKCEKYNWLLPWDNCRFALDQFDMANGNYIVDP